MKAVDARVAHVEVRPSPRVHESRHWDAPGRSPKSWRITTSGTSSSFSPSRSWFRFDTGPVRDGHQH
jgi:hypothetical protein